VKRVLLVLLIPILLFLVVPVSANTALNFQQPADFTAHISCIGTGTCSWVESTTGGNNYIQTASTQMVVSQTASPMTYSAVTTTGNWVMVTLYDSSFGSLYHYEGASGAGRYEMKITGGQATIYKNGASVATSGALAQNPSYVGWASATNTGTWIDATIDDVVWGSSEPFTDAASDKYVYGMPETVSNGTPYYTIMKDFINPAASGFYTGGGALLDSYHFTSTFSKGNNNSDTINLQGYTTGVNVLANTTGTAYTGTISWDLTSFFAANPNYGMYAMHSPSSLKYSDLIIYVGNGATISWSKPTYSQGETGAIITSVMTGGYWDPATYDYRIDVMDIYGVVDATYPVTTQTSTVSHTWDADQDIGLYFAAIIATPKTGTSPADDIWMNVAYCNVDAYLTLYGYVFNGENETVISGASVSILQGVTAVNSITPADGNYTASGLSQGATISINVSATGYETYLHQFTPLRVGSLMLNFTLLPTSHTYTGIALGGVAREIPYNRTINNARVDIVNASDGHTYTATTNSVGYYIQNGMAGTSHWFDVWGSKTGFLNSTVYQKLVVGS